MLTWRLRIAASREAMSEARLPLAYRDSCAGLLIPLNRCRYEEYYLPWKCEVSLFHTSHLPPTSQRRPLRAEELLAPVPEMI
jgi:hypothetical protein